MHSLRPLGIKSVGHTAVVFHDDDGNQCGHLQMVDGKLCFLGNADESARQFFQALCALWNLVDPRPAPPEETMQ